MAVEILTKDFIVDQTIKNECELELGVNWASLKGLPNNAPLELIKETLKEIV